MFNLIIASLLPVTIILLLGYLAGARRDFTKEAAAVFNQMVMLYALPLCLFSSIIALPIDELIAQKELAIGLFIGIVVMFWIVLLVLRYAFKVDWGLAALISITVTCPSAAFVGLPILGTFFGQISSVAVAVTSISMNLFQVPVTIMCLLSSNNNSTDNTQTGASKKAENPALKNLAHALKQPIVIAPLLALILAFFRIKFPDSVISAFDLLGKSTSGVALFASGIILFSYKIKITKTVWLIVLFRNLIIPFAIWGLISYFGFSKEIIRETVLTLAIPTATMSLILSIQYNRAQQLTATSFFLSTLVSLGTMGIFISLLIK